MPKTSDSRYKKALIVRKVLTTITNIKLKNGEVKWLVHSPTISQWRNNQKNNLYFQLCSGLFPQQILDLYTKEKYIRSNFIF